MTIINKLETTFFSSFSCDKSEFQLTFSCDMFKRIGTQKKKKNLFLNLLIVILTGYSDAH